MPLLNTPAGYGAVSKTLHWTIVFLFVWQYAFATIMLRVGQDERFLGLGQGDYFNWHKSMGLVALFVAVCRLSWRMATPLPDWAEPLSASERRVIPRLEQVLYGAMLLMPVSGYLYVMAGDYGVLLWGIWPLSNPIGKQPALAQIAKWTHILASYGLLAALAGHIGLVLRHQLVLKDGLLHRMLPGDPTKATRRAGWRPE